MAKTILVLLLGVVTFFSCNDTSKKQNPVTTVHDSNKIEKQETDLAALPGEAYKFDTTASVNGCSDVLLQKISKDMQYELVVDLIFDSIPKYSEIDITEFTRHIQGYLNKYPKTNPHISHICDDVFLNIDKEYTPIKYNLVSGKLNITYWSEKEHIVSAFLTNLVFKDSSNKTINLKSEYFDKLRVHWVGG